MKASNGSETSRTTFVLEKKYADVARDIGDGDVVKGIETLIELYVVSVAMSEIVSRFEEFLNDEATFR